MSGSQVGLTVEGRSISARGSARPDGTDRAVLRSQLGARQDPAGRASFCRARRRGRVCGDLFGRRARLAEPEICVNPLSVLARASSAICSAASWKARRSRRNRRFPRTEAAGLRSARTRAWRLRPAASISSAVDQLVERDQHGLVLDLAIVQPRAAAADQSARLALRGGETAAREQIDRRGYPLPARRCRCRRSARRRPLPPSRLEDGARRSRPPPQRPRPPGRAGSPRPPGSSWRR